MIAKNTQSKILKVFYWKNYCDTHYLRWLNCTYFSASLNTKVCSIKNDSKIKTDMLKAKNKYYTWGNKA